MSEVSNAAPAAEPTSVSPEATTSDAIETQADATSEDHELSAEADTSADDRIKAELEKALKRKLKYKVDGEEIEEEIDLSNEDELKRRLSLSKAAQKRMNEAAQLKKDVTAFVDMLGKDPARAMEALGFNYEEMVNSFVQNKLSEMEKSPEQLEREKLQKELEELKAEKERERQAREEAEQQRLQDQYADQFNKDIENAFKEGKYNIPKSPAVLRRIADTLLLAIENGHKNVTVKDVLPIVEKQYLADIHELFGQAPEDKIEHLMGKQASERLRNQRIAQAKAQKKTKTANQIVTHTGDRILGDDKNGQKDKIYMRDFFKNLK